MVPHFLPERALKRKATKVSEKIMYFAPDNPSLTLKLAGKRYQAMHGVFKDLPPEAEADLEKQLKTMPHVSALVKRVDMEEAAEKAKAFLAAQPPAAIKGPVTSGTSQAAKLREARQAQTPENLTGRINPVNVSTNARDDKPLAVEQIPTTAPKSNLLGRLGNSGKPLET